MTVLDIQANFTAGTNAYTSIVGAAGTYLAPNSYDTSPLGAYLTEVTAADTQLSANVNAGRDFGGGQPLYWFVDWTEAPNNLTSVKMQLITSATSDLGTPTVILDTGAVVIATLIKGYRTMIALPRSSAYLQYLGVQGITLGTTSTTGKFVSWLGLGGDSVVQGYASGFSVK